MVSRETSDALETLAFWSLIYCAIGTFIWCFLIQCGVIGHVFANTRKAHGRAIPIWFAFRASLLAIIAWPVFLGIAIRHPKGVLRRLKKMWWGGVRA